MDNEKYEEVLRLAEGASRTGDWTDVLGQVFGNQGLIRQVFPDHESAIRFSQSPEYGMIVSMLVERMADEGHRPPISAIELSGICASRAADRDRWFNDIGDPLVDQLKKLTEHLDLHSDFTIHRHSLGLYFDLADFRADEIAGAIAALSDMYRAVGGDRLIIEHFEILEPDLAPVEG